jgi:hypothetical protein
VRIYRALRITIDEQELVRTVEKITAPFLREHYGSEASEPNPRLAE